MLTGRMDRNKNSHCPQSSALSTWKCLNWRFVHLKRYNVCMSHFCPLLLSLTLNPKITIAFPNPHCSTIFIALKRTAIIKWQLLQAVWVNTHSYVLHLYCISVGLWIGRVYQKVPWKHERRTLCGPLQVCINPCSKFRPLWIWHGTIHHDLGVLLCLDWSRKIICSRTKGRTTILLCGRDLFT